MTWPCVRIDAVGWGEMGRRAARGMRRRLLVFLVLLLGLWVAPHRTVWAESGRPAGWKQERATEELVVGKLSLRYEPDLEDDARWLARRAPLWWSSIETNLSGDVDDEVRITFVDHAGGVSDATGMPRWVAGVAHPPSGEIMIARHGPDGLPTDLENLLKHEMAHVVLHRAAGGAALPRWFHEGVAESFAGGISLVRAQTLATAVFGTGVPDLDRLEQAFHATDPARASMAYAAARDLVTHLRFADPHGATLRRALAGLREGYGFEVAFVRAYHRALREVVAEWRTGLPGRFVWYPLAASGGLPFFFIGPLVMVAFLRRRRLVRRGWERLEREDEAARGPVLFVASPAAISG